MSKFPIKPKSRTDEEKQCPQCLQLVNKRIGFCLDCGDFIEPTMAASSKALSRSGRQRAVAQDQPQARRVLRGSPLKTPVLMLAAVLATILLGLFALTVYECCSNFDSNHKDLVRLAEGYLAKGDEANAINVLERSLLEEKRPEEQRQVLLDRALFSLASKMVTQGKYRDAVTCYSRISPGFEHHDEVLKLIAEYSDKALPVIFGAADKGQDVSPVNILMHQSNAAKSASMSRLEKAVMTVVPTTTKAAPRINDKLMPAVAPERSNSSANNNSSTSNNSSVPALAPSLTHTKEVAPQPSSVKGIARYNELLADYFARHSGSTVEPPSYEEWVKSGTKDF